MAELFRQVGEFPVYNRRQIISSPKNSMDKCTIVSIFPKLVDEVKHTIEPGRFVIPVGEYESPSTLYVGTSSWWKEIDELQPILEIPVSSVQVANAVINDYCNGIFGCDMGDRMPGLFFVLGEIDPKDLKSKFANKLNEMKVRQENWFAFLCMAADALWARSNGNPLAISDDMRLAARGLGRDYPWLKDFSMSKMVSCFACGSLRNPQFPVCPSCKVVDQSHPLAKELKFAV